jgi:translation initiation factor 1
MLKNKKKKIDGQGDISLRGTAGFSVSIGDFLEKPHSAAGLEEEKKPPDDGGARQDIEAFMRSVSQATIHMESSGRSGRIVTVLGFRPAPDKKTAEALVRAMRKGLGCGSYVDVDKVVLQGDIGDRAEAWLFKRGVRKIVMGN